MQSPSKTFLKALCDGSLDTGMRLLLSFALGFGITAAVFAMILFSTNGGHNWSDTVAAVWAIFGIILGLPILYWIWTRGIGHKPICLGLIGTCTVVGLWFCAAVMIASTVKGWQAQNVWFSTIAFLFLSAIALVWTFTLWWGYRRRLTWHLAKDVEIFCIECGYNLHGRHDTSCPECGNHPPLHELIQKQGIAREKSDEIKSTTDKILSTVTGK